MKAKKNGCFFPLVLLAAVLIAAGGWLYARGFGGLLTVWRLTRDWAAAEQADFQLTVQSEEFSLTAEGWWDTEPEGRVLYLQVRGFPVYAQNGILATDSGRSYALPEIPITEQNLRELALAALLEGEITKQDSTWHLSLPQEGISLTVWSADDRLSGLQVTCAPVISGKATPLTLSLTAAEPQTHSIPEKIRTALAASDPPALTEVLEPLISAAADLSARQTLEGALTVAVDCGILTVDETFRAVYDPAKGTLLLKTEYAEIPVTLPQTETPLSPAVLPMLLLRSGAMTETDEGCVWDIALEPELTKELCTALIPELADLDLSFSAMEAQILVRGGAFASASLTAGGEIPFLMTEIPISLTIEWLFD